MTPPGKINLLDRRSLWIAFLLALGVLVEFNRLSACGFINYDDPVYVLDNPYVQSGLSFGSCQWAFTTFDCSNWHPLTWLSLQLDADLYGIHASGFHRTNVWYHCANTLLLFFVLSQMTGAVYRSAFVAAFFAFHPLHVESVAWITERKDVLSTFFWLLTIGAYLAYTKRPGILRYLLVFLALALGLLAKPMLVTLPCVLLLLDFWPLARLPISPRPAGIDSPSTRKSWSICLAEKIPLFILVAVSAVITVVAQASAGSFQSLDKITVSDRFLNATHSYVVYLRQLFWPTDLAFHYPFEARIWSDARVLLSIALLASLSAACWVARKSAPYLLVGWCWYLGTLFPVIGLFQVGVQARADRYTYVPLIGVFILLVWGASELAARLKVSWRPCLALGGCGLVLCAGLTWVQQGYWQNSVTLWQHSLAVTGSAFVANQNLAGALVVRGDAERALPLLQECVRQNPGSEISHYMLGLALSRLGRYREAIDELLAAVRLNPDHELAISSQTQLPVQEPESAQLPPNQRTIFVAPAGQSRRALLAQEFEQLYTARESLSLAERELNNTGI